VPITFVDRELGTSKMSMNIFREALIGVISMRFKSIFFPS
jgi:dolichol-phosphate mannosyltransferase